LQLRIQTSLLVAADIVSEGGSATGWYETSLGAGPRGRREIGDKTPTGNWLAIAVKTAPSVVSWWLAWPADWPTINSHPTQSVSA